MCADIAVSAVNKVAKMPRRRGGMVNSPDRPSCLLVATRNPVKEAATRRAASHILPGCDVRCHDAPSGVSEQPLGPDETLLGATNRARQAGGTCAGGWGIGMEQGVELRDGALYALGSCVVWGGGRLLAQTSTPGFRFPSMMGRQLATEIVGGAELRDAAARVIGGAAEVWGHRGVVLHLSAGAIDRESLWYGAVSLALGIALIEAAGS